ncbi:hypothetical protein TNCV_1198871 [Trichonephila clavipes]|uniref:Uncharacterized protein n=1 Tax=Trichonephila clavipes TaxID=2585209 RepID=A0A8X6RZL8_TRICX|nr:hypothetical protein TNCV_1198871 [Trichonephila clavipes]
MGNTLLQYSELDFGTEMSLNRFHKFHLKHEEIPRGNFPHSYQRLQRLLTIPDDPEPEEGDYIDSSPEKERM